MDKHFENDGERKNLSPRPPMKRRDFLKLSAMAGGAFFAGGLLSSASAQDSENVGGRFRRKNISIRRGCVRFSSRKKRRRVF